MDSNNVNNALILSISTITNVSSVLSIAKHAKTVGSVIGVKIEQRWSKKLEHASHARKIVKLANTSITI